MLVPSSDYQIKSEIKKEIYITKIARFKERKQNTDIKDISILQILTEIKIPRDSSCATLYGCRVHCALLRIELIKLNFKILLPITPILIS